MVSQKCPMRYSSPVMSLWGGAVDFWREDDTCSYCGSLHPDVFMSRLRSQEPVCPTDKSYKAYLGVSKFYYHHLTDEQRQEFKQLVANKELVIAYPHYFYVLPYFM